MLAYSGAHLFAALANPDGHRQHARHHVNGVIAVLQQVFCGVANRVRVVEDPARCGDRCCER
jgi:hypothetical protein